MEPQVARGDEPHYLMVINSILFDKDLQLQEDYRRVEQGGWEAGKQYRGQRLDHHTYLVDPVTGESEFWRNIYEADAPIRQVSGQTVGFQRKQQGRFDDLSRTIERSSHPIGFPAAMAALIAWMTPDMTRTESRVSWAVLFVSGLTLICIFLMARKEGLGDEDGFMVVGLLLFATSWLAYSRSYFAETLLGFLLTLALWAMRSDRIMAASLAVVLAVAVKPQFALVGLGWIVERLWARRIRSAFLLALLIALGGAGLVAFNEWQAHIPLIAGNSDNRDHWRFPNLDTLFHYRYGLFLFVPWTLVVFAMMGKSLSRFSQDSRNLLIRQIALPSFFFLMVLSMRGFTGQWSYGPRYWVPFLPWFALILGMTMVGFGAAMRRMICGLVLISILIGFLGALFYPLNWGKHPFYAFALLLK